MPEQFPVTDPSIPRLHERTVSEEFADSLSTLSNPRLTLDKETPAAALAMSMAYDGEAYNDRLKTGQQLNGVILAGGEGFGVVTIHDYANNRTAYALTRFASEAGARAQLVTPLQEGVEMIIGRDSLSAAGHENPSAAMSRMHFSVKLEHGAVIINDKDSANKTEIMSPRVITEEMGVGDSPVKNGIMLWSAETSKAKNYLDVYSGESEVDSHDALEDEDDEDWNYTRHSKQVFGEVYRGRRQIERDSRIDGGVYMGTYGGEAIVVDSKNRPEAYDALLEQAKEIAHQTGRPLSVEVAIGSVYKAVGEKMQYSQQGVDTILNEAAKMQGKPKFEDGTKLDLGAFISRGVGVCRHQALACGVLLERMIDQGLIRGQVSVDRNKKWSPLGDRRDGHAWARFTTEDGRVFIIDVAQRFIGTLEDSRKRDGWSYMRPEDKRRFAAEDSGKRMVRRVLEQ